jgi:hypothetical protein
MHGKDVGEESGSKGNYSRGRGKVGTVTKWRKDGESVFGV